MACVRDLYPAAGAPDADDHGRRADVHRLVVLQWLGDVEKQGAGLDLKFQVLVLFLNGDLARFIQLGQLHIVQIDPGKAGR